MTTRLLAALILAAIPLHAEDAAPDPKADLAIYQKVNEIAKQADDAAIGEYQCSPELERQFRSGAITVTGWIKEVWPRGRVNGMDGSVVRIDGYRLTTGVGGTREGRLEIFIHGLYGLNSGDRFVGTIYPYVNYSPGHEGRRRYAIGVQVANMKYSEVYRTPERRIPIPTLVKADQEWWGAK